MKNQGLINEKTFDNRDWIYGGVTGIAGEVLQPDGQWVDYLPVDEYQSYAVKKGTQTLHFDSYCCVSFSGCNALEILHKKQYGKEINLSDRFTCVVSGTKPYVGNSLSTVAFSMSNKDGFLYQVEYKNESSDVNDFYKELNKTLISTAKSNLKGYKINYEWVYRKEPEVIMEALKESPLHIAIPTNWVKLNGIYHQKAYSTRTSHAVTLVGYVEGEYWIIFDHYKGNELRKLSWDYYMGAKIKYYIKKLTDIKPMPKLPVNIKNNVLLKDATRTQDIGLYLDGKLIVEDEKDNDYRVLKEGIARNNGDLKDKIISVNAEIWDSLTKINLKGKLLT